MGNDNLRRSQVALESTFGTPPAVTQNRNLVGALSLINRPERVLREEYRASMGGSNTYDDLSYRGEGSYTSRLVTSELPYWLAAAIVGAITGVVSGAGKLYTYTMPLTLAGTPPALTPLSSLTLYAGDNTQALRAAGAYCSRLVIRGSNTEAMTVEATFLTREVVYTGEVFRVVANPINVTLPNLMGRISMDPTGASIGATPLTGTYYGYTWTWDSGIAPDYTMDGTGLDYSGIHRDAPSATLEVTAKWNANMVNEFGSYRSLATGKRFARVAAYGPTIGAGPERQYVYLDGCYYYTDFTPLDSERDGTTLARATLAAVEDATWGKKVEVSVMTDPAVTFP